MDATVVDIILARIDKLEDKVDKLLEFKWQIVGGTVLVSLLMTGVVQLLAVFVKLKT